MKKKVLISSTAEIGGLILAFPIVETI